LEEGGYMDKQLTLKLWQDLEQKIRDTYSKYDSKSENSLFLMKDLSPKNTHAALNLFLSDESKAFYLYFPEQIEDYDELLIYLLQMMKRNVVSIGENMCPLLRDEIINTPLEKDHEILLIQSNNFVVVGVDIQNRSITIPQEMIRPNLIARYEINDTDDYCYINRYSVVSRDTGEIEKKCIKYTIDKQSLQIANVDMVKPEWLESILHYTDFYVNPTNIKYHKFLYHHTHLYHGEYIFIFSLKAHDMFVKMNGHWLLFDNEWFNLNGHKFHEKAHQELLLFKNIRMLQVQ
jgi:hypothetical protein